MSMIDTTRPFAPGTTGWTADDLDDPEIARLWDAGAYEIVEGVLTLMPPAYLDSSIRLRRLIRIIERHLERSGGSGEFGTEADLIVARKRVARVDAVFMTPQDLKQQEQTNARVGKTSLRYGRLRIAPTLVIESLSLGHEDHDRETKRQWYAEAGIAHYWLLNAFDRSLECLKLSGGGYQIDVAGREKDEVRPSLFPGLIIPLAQLWA